MPGQRVYAVHVGLSKALFGSRQMDLREAIDEARQHVNDPPPNESTTCDWVILRLLRAAGYAVREIFSRDADAQRNFPDYTVLPDDEAHTFYLEAKAWKVNLENGHAAQTLNYANQNGRRWAVLTNGREWRLYDNDIRGLPEEKLVAQASLEGVESGGMHSFLTAIGKESVCSDGLAPYAEQQVKRRSEEERARNEKEKLARRREQLAEIVEGEIAETGSPLMEALLAHLKDRQGLDGITAEDVVSVLGKDTVEVTESPGQAAFAVGIAPIRAGDDGTGVASKVIEELLRSKPSVFDILGRRPHCVGFLPKSWVAILPENGTAPQWRNLTRRVSIGCWFDIKTKTRKLALGFLTSTMNDPKLRQHCMEKLREAGFEYRGTAVWSWFYVRRRPIADMNDANLIRQNAAEMLQEAEREFPRAEKVFKEVFKNR